MRSYIIRHFPRISSRLIIFNIDLIDLFNECKTSNIANYADNTTPYRYICNFVG